MKFAIAAVITFAALALAAPTVDVIAKRGGGGPAQTIPQQEQVVNKCKNVKNGKTLCCANDQQAKPSDIANAAPGVSGLLDGLLGGLLGAAQIPVGLNCNSIIPVLSIPLNLACLGGDKLMCCQGGPHEVYQQNIQGGSSLLSINNNAPIVPINNLCLASV
ncbi:hypothetical protein BJ878DRAFT_478555 [Calycina marina]|uniref:Hydrophobin n=1 Tax=Calycina marina TaxID=1763456 RepID=A0A9P7Z6C2_9HELO|nr:hypothetical protein BJ878DRAFT_478555 [Calycina marina]